MAVRFSRFNDSINCCNNSRYVPRAKVDATCIAGFNSPIPSTKIRGLPFCWRFEQQAVRRTQFLIEHLGTGKDDLQLLLLLQFIQIPAEFGSVSDEFVRARLKQFTIAEPESLATQSLVSIRFADTMLPGSAPLRRPIYFSNTLSTCPTFFCTLPASLFILAARLGLLVTWPAFSFEGALHLVYISFDFVLSFCSFPVSPHPFDVRFRQGNVRNSRKNLHSCRGEALPPTAQLRVVGQMVDAKNGLQERVRESVARSNPLR